MGWARDELEAAFRHYQDTVARAAASGDWNLFADLFTEDATYVEHAYGTFAGRDAIRAWVVRTMAAFPGNCMPSFPVGWSVFDVDRGWIVCEIVNRMADPGDGSVHEAANLTRLVYAGGNLFSCEEDVYNPARFLETVRRWARVAAAHGRLPDDGRRWLDTVAPGWDRPAA
jgi:uncharacterized protein (TIGR02246 family)